MDHLPFLQQMSEDEVKKTLLNEFINTEALLENNLQQVFNNNNKRRESSSYRWRLSKLDSDRESANSDDKNGDLAKLRSGSFATIALMINEKLYISNLGTNYCILVTKSSSLLSPSSTTQSNVSLNDNNMQLNLISLTDEHSLSNPNEMERLLSLKANFTQETIDRISYTRCFGNFDHKNYYKESDVFR
jgi:serine/threonine protein phosphatase PrpC